VNCRPSSSQSVRRKPDRASARNTHHQFGHARARRAHVGGIQRFERGLGLVTERPIPVRFICACKTRDRRGGIVGVGKQVQRAAIGPVVPRQQIQRRQSHVIFERVADFAEQIVEHPTHGENGRTRVDPAAGLRLARLRTATRRDLPDLAANGVTGLAHNHVAALMGERQRRCQAANAGSNDDHTWSAHNRLQKSVPLRASFDLTPQSVN